MSRKIIMLLAAALIGTLAFTTACNKDKETAAEEAVQQAEQNTPEFLAKKYFTATTFESMLALEQDCTPDYAEYLNGQKIGNKDMFPIMKKLVKAVKLNDAEELSKTMVSFFTNDLTWKSMLALMGAAAAPGQVSEEDLQTLRKMLITTFQSMSSQQKEMMLQKTKESLKEMENQRTIFLKNAKITGTKIEGDTAVITAEANVPGETDPEVAAILGNKVGYEITMKMIDGKWKYQTFKTNFKQ